MRKKRYKYSKGRKVEREPTEREKTDDVVPGYADMKKLSLGITQEENGPDEPDPQIRGDKKKDELFSQRWKEFATGQELEGKIDNLLDLNDDALETMRDRLVNIIQMNPEFSKHLFYFLEPLKDAEVRLDERGTEKQMRACNRLGYYSFAYFLQQLDVINRAASGKLNQPKK